MKREERREEKRSGNGLATNERLKRTKVEAESESESRKQEAKKQNEKHGNEACTETRWRQVQRFCFACLMGRRKEEEYKDGGWIRGTAAKGG